MTIESGASSDLTPLFKSCVKTIRTRNKATGVTLPQTKIFPTSPTPFSQFYSKAKDLMSNIISHQNLLKDHQKKYLLDQENSMSDHERSYMEKVVSTNLRIIDDNIRTLTTKLPEDQHNSRDATEYQQVIMAILKMNFQEINSTFKHMKELRKKKQKEKDSLYRLHRPGGVRKRSSSGSSEPTPLPSKKGDLDITHTTQSNSHSQSTDSEDTESTHQDQENGGTDVQRTEKKTDVASVMENEVKSASPSLLDEEMESMLGELSGEERQVLEQENAHFYQELRSNQEEVRQITTQVVELGQMQDLLSENVDLQAHQIEEIQETIIASTENVREGNEQVREAMRKDAGFRVWIMFFLIVMSCTILFLDWYNS